MEGKGREGGAQLSTAAATTTTTISRTPESMVVKHHQPQAQPQPPPQLPPQPQAQPGRRRRGGKRKANNTALSSTTAKRQARERLNASLLPPHHNGPITRARQSPNKFAISAAEAAITVAASVSSTASSASFPQNPSEALPNPVFSAAGGVTAATEKSNTVSEELVQDLESLIDAEFDALRSRDDNVHVIPTHDGWFSWTKVHPLEEHALASFFDGKSEKRTPDVYMEIRNFIVKKFHEDSKTQIEPKDLSELSVGELDMRQEIMEFLDHWGLINFQPFPLLDSAIAAPNADGAAKPASLIEKLYKFETVESHTRVGSKAELAAPAIPLSLFPEPSIADEVRPEGPSVEYHCNSCSADCSRKRYHCQKQADFDLCSECFNNGKFDSGMSHADFIIMESAEIPGASGGSWTDQETLLLLEALELFGGNWNEIAEHVATKTKAQCILHFVQMPIEDTFFEDKDDNASLKGDIVPGSSKNDPSGSKDAPEGKDNIVEANNDSSTIKNTPEARDDVVETNNDSSTSKSTPELTDDKSAAVSDSSAPKDAPETEENESSPDEEKPISSSMDILKRKDASEVKLPEEMSTNIALSALKEAFQAVGSLPEPGSKLSFAEAGNPVMALAAYLARLVESDVAAASARCSLKTISEESPGIQLAARHCFVLEDPPYSKNDASAPVSTVVEMAGEEAREHEDKKEENNQEEHRISAPSGSDTKPLLDEKMGDAVSKEKESGLSSGDGNKEISDAGKESDDKSSKQDVVLSAEKESDGSALPQKDQPSSATEPVDLSLPGEVVRSSGKESCDELPECPPEMVKPADMVSNPVPMEENESRRTVASSLTVQEEAISGKDDKPTTDIKEENNVNGSKNKNGDNIERIKRAAVTALSAAAVKAKLLANQEEDQVRQLTTFLIEKQLNKLEMKMSFFNDMDNVIVRAREQMNKSRQQLYQERAQIIASRLGISPSSSRTVPPSLPINRVAMSYANAVPKPHPGMNFQRQPMKTNARPLAPNLSGSTVPTTTVSGASSHISQQEKLGTS